MILSARHVCLTTLAAVLSVASFTACNVDDVTQNPGAAVRNNDLEHKFVQATCQSTTIFLKTVGPAYKVMYDFSSEVVTRSTVYFKNSDCTQPVLNVDYRGGYTKGAEGPDNVFQLDTRYDHVEINPLDASVIADLNAFNTTGLCGQANWQVNVPVDETANVNATLCPLDNVPQNLFDIYTIENNNLILGSGDKTDATKRPTELDRNDLYTQQQ